MATRVVWEDNMSRRKNTGHTWTGHIPKLDRGRRAGVFFKTAGQEVLRVEPLDLFEI